MKLFETPDVLGNRITLTSERWNHALKHELPGMDSLRQCLQDPDEIRRSRKDADVRLYYRSRNGMYICVVVHSAENFIITAYQTGSMKRGETLWTRH